MMNALESTLDLTRWNDQSVCTGGTTGSYLSADGDSRCAWENTLWDLTPAVGITSIASPMPCHGTSVLSIQISRRL